MNNSPDVYMERLLEVSNKKYRLLQDIFLLTGEQSRNINEDGVEGLQQLIDNKQIKIDEINKQDEEFNVYFQRLKAQLKINSLEELSERDTAGIKGIKELKALIRQIMELTNEIYVVENQNNEKAKDLLGNIAGEIRKINDSKKVNVAYRPTPVQQQSYFLDKKK